MRGDRVKVQIYTVRYLDYRTGKEISSSCLQIRQKQKRGTVTKTPPHPLISSPPRYLTLIKPVPDN